MRGNKKGQMEITVFVELPGLIFVCIVNISIHANIDQGHGEHYRASQHEAMKSLVYI
jgi:hypothetical protein